MVTRALLFDLDLRRIRRGWIWGRSTFFSKSSFIMLYHHINPKTRYGGSQGALNEQNNPNPNHINPFADFLKDPFSNLFAALCSHLIWLCSGTALLFLELDNLSSIKMLCSRKSFWHRHSNPWLRWIFFPIKRGRESKAAKTSLKVKGMLIKLARANLFYKFRMSSSIFVDGYRIALG